MNYLFKFLVLCAFLGIGVNCGLIDQDYLDVFSDELSNLNDSEFKIDWRRKRSTLNLDSEIVSKSLIEDIVKKIEDYYKGIDEAWSCIFNETNGALFFEQFGFLDAFNKTFFIFHLLFS